jgi:undecaprenyl-diphosphatase
MFQEILQFVHNILPYAETFGPFVYVFIFLAICIESLPFLGLFIPGIAVLVFFGYAAGEHTVHLGLAVVCAFLGAVLGDIFGYFLGKYGNHFLDRHKRWLESAHVNGAKKFLHDHGGKSIFIGRFFGPARAILSLVAGMAHMPFLKFNIYNILGVAVWVNAYMLIGFFFGQEWRVVSHYISRFTTEATVLVVVIFVIFFIRRKYRTEIYSDLSQK